jgi:chorismate mutase/prephenate dehydratase
MSRPRDVERVRRDIDTIDARLLSLLNRRALASQEIGRIKKREGRGIYSPEREKQVLDRLKAMNRGPLTPAAIDAIYREVMSSSISLEKPVQIAYLGPAFTFTHQAAQKKFGASVDYLSCDDIAGVFQMVENGKCDYGVVPVENSTEGAVSYTLDMFIRSDLKICAEVYLPITHHLLSRAKSLGAIRSVYSHPNAFGQCRLWLQKHMPGVNTIPTPSTTDAARAVGRATKGAAHDAAIASPLAAKAYGLKVLARSIEDNAFNTTRFIVISRTEAKPTRSDRTSIVFEVKDKVGALHDILVPFKRARVNLTKIESRPSKKRVWSYYFFVDFEGHHGEPRVARALRQLRRHCSFLKVLGSHPKADA